VVGSGAEALFGIGLLGASALAAVVVPLATAYGVAEAAGTERSVSRTFAEAPLFLGLFTGQVVIGAAVALAPGNLIDLLIPTQVGVGDEVHEQQALLVIESMKMEHMIAAEQAGIVERVGVDVGATVYTGDLLVALTEGSPAAEAASNAPEAGVDVERIRPDL